MRFSIHRAAVFVSYCASVLLIWSTILIFFNISVEDEPKSDYNVDVVVKVTNTNKNSQNSLYFQPLPG